MRGFEATERSDHGAIVGAELKIGIFDWHGQGSRHLVTELLIGGYASGDDHAGRCEFVVSVLKLTDDGFYGDALEAGCNISLLGCGEPLWQLRGGKIVRFPDLRLGEPQNGCL